MARSKDVARKLLRQHPLQRLESPSAGLSALLHSIGLVPFIYDFVYLVRNPNPVNESYGWHMQYLTIIGLSLATATFAVGLLADITRSHRLFQLKNVLSVTSAPMSCLISLLYWSLHFIDPGLVLPDWAPRLALHSDLCFHAAPALLLLTDLLFFSPPYTIAFVPALGLSGVIAFSYWFWIEQCYKVNKFYPYPIFDILNTYQRVGLFAFSALLMALSTATLSWLYTVVNGKDAQDFDLGSGRATKKSKSGNVKGE